MGEQARDARVVELELENTRLQLKIERLRKAEDEHQSSAQRLQAFYQHVPIGYVTLNEVGTITAWNTAAAELLDRKHRGLGKMPLSMFIPKNELRVFLRHLMRCKKARQDQVASELRIKSGDLLVPIQMISVRQLSGGRRLFQTALVDLTERKRNETALNDAKEFSDAIIQTTHEPLVVLGPDIRILRCNDAFARLFRVKHEQSKGLSLGPLLNIWWQGNDLLSRLEHCLVNQVALTNFDFEVQPRGLGRRIFIFNARPLYKKDGSLALLVALEDITARKEAEERSADSHRQLQELNNELEKRVEDRTRELRDSNKQLEGFCYSIAHDLRGPLRAMAGFGAALQQSYVNELGERGADYIHRIIGAATQMDELIHDLLEYGRFNTAEIVASRIDAEDVLNRVIEHLQPEIQESHATIERKKRLPSIIGHRIALEAAFSNLLSNAIKFVPPQRSPHVAIWPEEGNDHVSICIEDNGIGIPQQHHAKIFEVFQRLHSPKDYPGTGIGLAIVSKAVQRMGGEVGVDSEPGKGSRFWINLPRAPQ